MTLDPKQTSNLDALALKLQALVSDADVYADGARVISQGGTPPPLIAILQAVDDTVLDRKLVFGAGDTTISLVASGRRLRGLLDMAPMSTAAQPLLGLTISREDPDGIAALRDLLVTAFANATHLTLRSLPAERFGSGGERGVTASGLETLWQVDHEQQPKAPTAPLERFLAENAGAVSSFIYLSNGAIAASQGDTAALQMIWDTQVEAYLAAEQKLANPQSGDRLICLEGALDDDSAAALAFAGNDVALLAYAPDHTGALHASWHALIT